MFAGKKRRPHIEYTAIERKKLFRWGTPLGFEYGRKERNSLGQNTLSLPLALIIRDNLWTSRKPCHAELAVFNLDDAAALV